MNEKQTAIMLGIFLISLAGAVEYNISAGDTICFDLNQTYANYSIEGTAEENLNIFQNETIVTIETSRYMQSDFFEITFFDEKGDVIYRYHSGGSGGYKEVYSEEIPDGSKIIYREKEEETSQIDEEKDSDSFLKMTGSVVFKIFNSPVGLTTFGILITVLISIIIVKIGRKKNG